MAWIGFRRCSSLWSLGVAGWAAALILISGRQLPAQAPERRVEQIRALYREVGEQVARSERAGEGEEPSLYRKDLVVNADGKMWPAVGTYRHTIRFYYTFNADRDEHPYPDRLLKTVVESQRAGVRTRAEYLFDASGRLAFYYWDGGDHTKDELRLYFDGPQLIRAMAGQAVVSSSVRLVRENARRVQGEAERIKSLFTNSLPVVEAEPAR